MPILDLVHYYYSKIINKKIKYVELQVTFLSLICILLKQMSLRRKFPSDLTALPGSTPRSSSRSYVHGHRSSKAERGCVGLNQSLYFWRSRKVRKLGLFVMGSWRRKH